MEGYPEPALQQKTEERVVSCKCDMMHIVYFLVQKVDSLSFLPLPEVVFLSQFACLSGVSLESYG